MGAAGTDEVEGQLEKVQDFTKEIVGCGLEQVCKWRKRRSLKSKGWVTKEGSQ